MLFCMFCMVCFETYFALVIPVAFFKFLTLSIVFSLFLSLSHYIVSREWHIRLYRSFAIRWRQCLHPQLYSLQWFAFFCIVEGRSCLRFVLVPCRPGCQHGSCSVPGECTCDPNWTGALCNSCVAGFAGPNCLQPVCRVGCQTSTATCLTPGTCTCNSGWSGNNCTQGHHFHSFFTLLILKFYWVGFSNLCSWLC